MNKRFSIIVPVLHEAPTIGDLVEHVRSLTDYGKTELIIVDGSPGGDTLMRVADCGAIGLTSPPGRARQMNAGAAAATGDILVFLHADTRLPVDALLRIERLLSDSFFIGGAFDLTIRSPQWRYRLIGALASWRTRLTRIPYGDQAIFISRAAFQRLGGYPDIPIMEDVALMRLVKKRGGKIAIIACSVVTSARRWEREGVLYATARNWLLLAAYYLGVPPERLARYYSAGRNR